VFNRYFSCDDIGSSVDFNRRVLGEDRYLTHILHVALPKHSIGFSPAIRVKTEAPEKFSALVRQRRRWALSAIANDCYMSSDREIWRKFPLMGVYKAIQHANRGTTLTQITIAVLAFSQVDYTDIRSWGVLALGVGIPLALALISGLLSSLSLGHYKALVFHLPMFVLMTLAQIWIDLYSMATCTKNNWGSRNT
jgi:cellulose synthase/poly-beta-1,6-N-acetylglucosamine synthase-like glycosyltransferase